MSPNTNVGGIIPGMSIFDVSAGASLGVVDSYIGGTLTLVDPAPFASQSLVTSLAAFTTDYSGILVPANPGYVIPGLTVIDATNNKVLGTLKSYGPLSVSQSAGFIWFAGVTTIDMGVDNNSPGIIPGMSIYDVTAKASLGTVASYIGWHAYSKRSCAV